MARKATVPMSFVAVMVRVRGFELHCGLRPRGKRRISMAPRIIQWRVPGREWSRDAHALPLCGETKRQVLARAAVILQKFNVPEAP